MRLLPDGLLDLMQCPQCHGPLREDEPTSTLVCEQCRLAYPVGEGGIPVMLAEAARPIDGASDE